jgi:hypothetical protein
MRPAKAALRYRKPTQVLARVGLGAVTAGSIVLDGSLQHRDIQQLPEIDRERLWIGCCHRKIGLRTAVAPSGIHNKFEK